MKRVSYIGIFFDEETQLKLIEMQEDKLPVNVSNMHCTFKYAPTRSEIKEFFRILGNKDVPIEIVGYASNGENSGFLINLSPEQKQVYTNDVLNGEEPRVRPAHITVSMAEGAHAVNTGGLNFHKLEKNLNIIGRAGALMKDIDRKREWIEFENPYKSIDYEER